MSPSPSFAGKGGEIMSGVLTLLGHVPMQNQAAELFGMNAE
jgi:hypothetical protein